MVSINATSLRFLLSATLMLGLWGCSSAPEQSLPSASVHSPQSIELNDQNADSAEDGTLTGEPQLTEAEKLELAPNLYMTQQAEVSAEIVAKFKQAQTLQAQQAWSQAQALFTELTQTQPQLSGPWLALADIALAQEDKEVAIAHYRKAIRVNKLNYYAHNRLASVLREQGEFAAAQQHYQAALESWPAFPEAHLNLAILLDLYLGEKHQARKHYGFYQALTEQEDRQVKGWIMDLDRQLQSQTAKTQKGTANE